MIRTEQINVGTEDNPIMRYRTYSTEGFLIERNGVLYSEAIDVSELSYTETNQVISNESEESIDAYKAALNAQYDGLKYISNTDNPFVLSFPMYVVANMFYKRQEEESWVQYVCVQTGIANEHNFRLYLEPFEN